MEQKLQGLLNNIILVFKPLAFKNDLFVERVYSRLIKECTNLNYIDYPEDIIKCFDRYPEIMVEEDRVLILKFVIEYNDIFYKNELEKNKKIKLLENDYITPSKVYSNNISNNIITPKKEIIVPDNNVFIEADLCFKKIKDNKSDLFEVMNILNNIKGNKLLVCKRILLDIKFEINEINKFINENRDSLSSDEIDEFYADIPEYDGLINFISNYCNSEKEEVATSTNRIIIPYADRDIELSIKFFDQIIEEKYLQILLLLESIEYNRFSKIKRLTDDGRKNGVLEVRFDIARILFFNCYDSYVLATAYLKNCKWGKKYDTKVNKATINCLNYINTNKEILMSDKDAEFYAKQNEAYQYVKTYLKEKARRC